MEKKAVEKQVRDMLFAQQDLEYGNFHSKLIPTIDRELVIGVRTPVLRKMAKDFAKTPAAECYLEILPHKYYEENNFHGMIIECIKDYDACIRAMDSFLPYVDNWATCDLISPRVFAGHVQLLDKIRRWIETEETYTIRFGIGMLMKHFLDKEFKPEFLEWVAAVRSEEYYVNMMIAWYFATALAKQYGAAAAYIEERRLETWTHNKAIQKAVESYRISDEQKAYLKALKVK